MVAKKSPKKPEKIASKTKELLAPFDLIQEEWDIMFPGLKLILEEGKKETVIGWKLGNFQMRGSMAVGDTSVEKISVGEAVDLIEEHFKWTAIEYFLEYGGK